MLKTHLLLRDNCRYYWFNLLSLSSIKLCFLFFLCHAAAESNTEDLIGLSSPPEIINFDIRDLEKLAVLERELKSQWNDYQQKMIDGFHSALAFQSQYPESEFAAKEVWRRYLETFNAENPYSTLDDQLRELAKSSPSDDSFLALLNETHSSLSTDKAEMAMPSVAASSTEITKADDSVSVSNLGKPNETTPEVEVDKQDLSEEEVSSSTLSNQTNIIIDEKISIATNSTEISKPDDSVSVTSIETPEETTPEVEVDTQELSEEEVNTLTRTKQTNTIIDHKIYTLVSESCITEDIPCKLRFEEKQTDRTNFYELTKKLLINTEFDKELLVQANRLHSLSSEAQELGKETLYSGPLKSTYSDGSVRFIGKSVKGLPSGNFQYFYPSGELALEGRFRFGWFSSKKTFREWHKNGQLARRYSLGADTRTEYEEFFPTGNKKVLQDRSGKRIEWYSNGIKRYEGRIKYGVAIGKHREWYPSGAIALEYQNVKYRLRSFHMKKIGYQLYPDGSQRWEAKRTSFTRYYPSGQVQLELKGKSEKAYYENGNLASERSWNGRIEADGKWTLWYSNGNLRQETDFDDGVRNGQVNIYYDNGVVAESGRYKDDQRDGVWITNTPNGTLKATVCYESGKSISCERTDS